LTIPRNLPSAEETASHLVACGLPKPHIFVNTPVQNPTHINQIHRNIFEGHYAQTEQFYLHELKNNRQLHMLGFEDDVRVIEPRTFTKKLNKLLDYLDQHRRDNWTMVNLGCAPLGPAVPIAHGLAVVSASYSLQGYLLNGRKVPWIMSLTRSVCERPWGFEGGRSIRFGENLAVRKAWLTQERLPKEFFFKDIPVLRDVVTYDRTMDLLMVIACIAPVVLLLAFVRLLVGKRFKWD
jgi:hypothetical protein